MFEYLVRHQKQSTCIYIDDASPYLYILETAPCMLQIGTLHMHVAGLHRERLALYGKLHRHVTS
jgi:hypothetical protein